ncbi:MAG: ABC transporter substrate-binding protein [Lachnospiraceae bacterium]|nr:ABC transporter substrate-binding protein [Lachnospiraceae bacterium]
MKKKGIIIFGILVIMIATLMGCGLQKTESKKAASEKVVLNEVAHSIFYAPMYVAIEEGYFAEEGIDIELVTGFGADKTMTAVLSGEANVGFMGSEASIYTYLGGTEDYVVNFAQLTQRAGNFLVAREPMQDFDWKMLEGKEVLGGRKGGMPEMVFEYILKKNGIDPSIDVKIDQSIDFGSTAAAFSGGQGDYTVEFEPAATSLEGEGKGYVVASLGEDSGYVPYTAFCAKKSYLESHGEIMQGFVNALQKGMVYVNNHTPEQIAGVIAPQFNETDQDTITKIVTRYYNQQTWKGDLIFEEDSFTLLQDILEEAGELSERVPYETLVTTEYATKAAETVK